MDKEVINEIVKQENERKKREYIKKIWSILSNELQLEKYITQQTNFPQSLGLSSSSSSFITQKEFFDGIKESLLTINYKTRLNELIENSNNLSDFQIIKKYFYEHYHQDLVYINKLIEELIIISFYCLRTDKNNVSKEEDLINSINKILNEYHLEYRNDKVQPLDSIWMEETKKDIYPLLKKQLYGQTKEFMEEAINKFNNGDYEDCSIWCGKSLETLFKSICENNKYTIHLNEEQKNKLTFASLLDLLASKDFFEKSELDNVKALNLTLEMFKQGVPKIRNDSAHGSWLNGKNPSKILAKLSVDLAFSYIAFILEIDKK